MSRQSRVDRCSVYSSLPTPTAQFDQILSFQIIAIVKCELQITQSSRKLALLNT